MTYTYLSHAIEFPAPGTMVSACAKRPSAVEFCQVIHRARANVQDCREIGIYPYIQPVVGRAEFA